MGEKPITRSGPCCFTVCTLAAAMISSASSQVARTKPPWPRSCWYSRRFVVSSWIDFQAATGSAYCAFASRHRRSKRLRIIGYFTRFALYRYQEYEAPREQPRGSWFGRPGRVRG
jgi:hypothetical protein